MPEISAKRFAAYAGIAFAVGAVLALLFGSLILPRAGSGGDDQPPIIVSDGSIIFEGGDKYNPNKGTIDSWDEQNTSVQQWKASKKTGFDVKSFTVHIAGVINPGSSGACPFTTLAGSSVEIDYTTASQNPTTLVFHVLPIPDGGHNSTEVTADDSNGLSVVAGYPSPPQLYAQPGDNGYISKVIVPDPNTKPSTTTTCYLPVPSDPPSRSLVRVTITPERK